MKWFEKRVIIPVLGLFGDTSGLMADLSPKIDWSTLGVAPRLAQFKRADLFAGIAPREASSKERT